MTPVVLCTCRAVFIAVVCSSLLVAVTAAAVLTYGTYMYLLASRRAVASLLRLCRLQFLRRPPFCFSHDSFDSFASLIVTVCACVVPATLQRRFR